MTHPLVRKRANRHRARSVQLDQPSDLHSLNRLNDTLCAIMKSMATRLLLCMSTALLFLVASAATVSAHDTWLSPSPFRSTKQGTVTLSLSSGMDYPKLDHPIAVDRVESARWRSARGSGNLAVGKPAANALEFRTDAGVGVTAFAVVLQPRPSKLKREQVREYVDHLGIPSGGQVYAEWERGSKPEETGYRYMKYAKTFVRTGRKSGKSAVWNTPLGMRLELVPQSDPTSLVAGNALEVLLLDGGKPLARYPVALLREGTKDTISSVTDDQGRTRLQLNAPGRYMLRGTILETSGQKETAWDVHFSTMTFDVSARR